MEILENLRERVRIQQGCENDIGKQRGAFDYCKKDIQFFFKYFLFTYDPRSSVPDRPFIPWDYQIKFINDLNADIMAGHSQLTEKSRDMGVTWMVLGVFLYRWLFFNETFLLGSRTEEEVDKIGNMKSLFERLRYLIAKLPKWMMDLGGASKCISNGANSSFMRIFKDNGSSLTGGSMNSNFSRQGRYKAILLDEFAFIDSPVTIWRACGDSAPCKVVVSTPNGNNNYFAELRKSGKIKINTIHWKQHPFKDEAWYEKQKEDRSPKDVAQELDINYTISAGDPFYQGFSRAMHMRRMRIDENKELILSWDYGFRHPNCCIHQITVEGIWLVVDNIFGENQTIDEFGEYVTEYLNANYKGFSYRHRGFGDPAGRQSSDKSRRSSEQILNEMGFKVDSIPSNSAHSSYGARKAIIEKKLRTLIGGIPALIINDVPNNQIIVDGFEGGYRYPDANKYGGVSEKPVDDGYFEHPFNCIEYFAVNMFKPVEQKPRPKNQVTGMINRLKQEQYAVNAGIGY